ncbi:MAG: adaptor protein MecA [Lachnospiraceae bacterium]|nr:adaptor protein MecA [Lachnospiraceae bacterium]
MKFRRLDENTVQCYITRDEMNKMGYAIEDLITDKDLSQLFADEIILHASEKLDDFPRSGNLAMQVMALGDGSMKITISEINANGKGKGIFPGTMKPGIPPLPFGAFLDTDDDDDEEDDEMFSLGGYDDDDDDRDWDEDEDFTDSLENDNDDDTDFDGGQNLTSEDIERVNEFFEGLKNYISNTKDNDEDIVEKQKKNRKKVEERIKADMKRKEEEKKRFLSLPKLFCFNSLEALHEFAIHANDNNRASTALYKSEQSGKYFLLVKKGRLKFKEFLSLCESLMEFSEFITQEYFIEIYCKEHFKCIIKAHAIEASRDYDF